MMLCSSTVTTSGTRVARSATKAVSSGLMVAMLTTSAAMPRPASSSAACSAAFTMWPHATRAMSDPSRSTRALPSSKR